MAGPVFSLELLAPRTGGAFVFRSSDEAAVRAELEKATRKPGPHVRARLWRTGGPDGPLCIEDRRLQPSPL